MNVATFFNHQTITDCYKEAKAAVLGQASGTDKAEHRKILSNLYEELGPFLPFPNQKVCDNPKYRLNPQTVDAAPHKFQLIKLLTHLTWIARAITTKGPGSASKRPEAFASRGRAYICGHVEKEMSDPDNPALSGAVLQGGTCGTTATVLKAIADTLDDETLRAMDIQLDLSKIEIYKMGDGECDHAFTLFYYNTDGKRLPMVLGASSRNPDMRCYRFSPTVDKSNLYVADGHQLFPMVDYYENVIFNHDHTQISDISIPLGQASAPKLDLGLALAIRREMIKRLNMGEQGIDTALLTWVISGKLFPSPVLDDIMRKQGVSNYAEIDPTRLSEPEQVQFQHECRKIEHEIEKMLIEDLYKKGSMEESWVGLCAPTNPAIVHRNEKSGEMLTASVPAHYFERTERILWAYDRWKRTRPERSALNDESISKRPLFYIHPSVKAIENMPFLSALAAARGMNLSKNTVQTGTIALFENALVSLENWVGKMQDDCTEECIAHIQQVGLTEEVRDAFATVRHNLQTFQSLMTEFAAEAIKLPEESEQRKRIQTLCDRTQASPIREKMDALVARFDSKLNE